MVLASRGPPYTIIRPTGSDAAEPDPASILHVAFRCPHWVYLARLRAFPREQVCSPTTTIHTRLAFSAELFRSIAQYSRQ